MLLDRVTIKNYKSFGEENNILDVNPNITTIIGKNGSGKTNILDFLTYFKPTANTNLSGLGKKKNLTNLDGTLSLTFELLFDKTEQTEYQNNERTKFWLSEDNKWHFEGGLYTVINDDKIINESKEYLLKFYKTATFRTGMKDRIPILTKKTSSLYLDDLKEDKRNLIESLNFVSDFKEFDEESCKNFINFIYDRLDFFTQKVPHIFVFNDDINLKNTYSLNEITNIKKNTINKDNKFIYLLLDVFDISVDDLIFILTPSNSSSAVKKKLMDVNQILTEKSKGVFERLNLYGLNLEFDYKPNIIEIFIIDNKNPVSLSERSNGLKWYLSFYLQMMRNNCLKQKTIVLMDEPGESVHIEAQKEILKWLDEISNHTQLIYTTHSPFMIDSEDLSKIVITEKVDGFSKIHNKVHGADLQDISRLETLSPLFKAIGYSCTDNIGPSFYKNNIITEGISDYYYLLGFCYLLNVEDKNIPNIIPSISVNNIHHICSILIGWGCSFKALLDYDNEGFKEYNNLLKLKLEQGKEIFTVNNNLFSTSSPQSTQSCAIEKILTEAEYQNVKNGDKFLLALDFYQKAKEGSLKLSEESKANITRLLEALQIKFNN